MKGRNCATCESNAEDPTGYREYEATTADGIDWDAGTAIDGCEAGASQPRGGSHKDSWQNLTHVTLWLHSCQYST